MECEGVRASGGEGGGGEEVVGGDEGDGVGGVGEGVWVVG